MYAESMSTSMKAYVLHGINDLRLEERAVPALTAGTALVCVKAAGICGSDIPRVYKTGTYHFPTIPGHEFSGEVVSVYDKSDLEAAKWVGKRVGIFPLIPCKKCDPCKNKLFEMCKSYSYLGSREDGGFAECVRVPLWNLIELPDNVSYKQAAMMEPMAVAVHSIRQTLGKDCIISDTLSEKEKNQVVAVYGLGTIGLMIVMFLWKMGYRNIIGIGNKEFQKDSFMNLTDGKGIFVDSRVKSIGKYIYEITDAGADVFFECVGRNGEAVGAALDSINCGGRLQLVGNPGEDITVARDSWWRILRRQLTVTGTWNSSYTHELTDDWHYVLSALADESIHPEKLITHVFDMNDLHKGFELMRDKTEPYVKVMGLMS